MADIAKISLPDGNTYDIVDKKSGYYKKPDSGIPKSDLASDVQTSLNKADSALPLSGGTVTGETTFNDNVHLENETYADSVTAGSLLVAGDARFVNGLYGNLKGNADSASSVAWDNVVGKPTSYTPSSHTHDDRYYTESEINTKVSDINSSITSHTGNKSNPHSVTKSQVGLGNVDNTSDINKPVSTAQQSAIDTAYANSNAYTDQKIADLINGAPSTLDTLGEIATAMAEHEDVVSALNEAIGTKASQSELDTHTGNSTIHITASERTNWNSAKTHADSAHARTDATKVEKSTTNGNILINGTETNVYTHPSGTNPHGTTKSDIGLGNVPNVATNDQTPSYTEATTLAKLTSGEKLSIAFGKISKAITDLISHIGNTSNPHSVTKSQIGLGNVENKSSATIRSELTKENVTTALGYTPPTTDTWRGIQNNLTSDSTTDSLSAAQGKVLDGKISTLQTNFQAGVDGIYDTIVAQGTTPASKSLSDVKAGINSLSTNRYNNGVSDTKVGTATADDVSKYVTFTNKTGVGITGSVWDRTNSQFYSSSPWYANINKNTSGENFLINIVDDYKWMMNKTNTITSGPVSSFGDVLGTTDASKVLSSETFTSSNGICQTGTMANQGAKTSSLNCGESYTIPAGYHNGSGKITANSLASQTSATATASDIKNGKTAWVSGSKITGTYIEATKSGFKGTVIGLVGNDSVTITLPTSSNIIAILAIRNNNSSGATSPVANAWSFYNSITNNIQQQSNYALASITSVSGNSFVLSGGDGYSTKFIFDFQWYAVTADASTV